MSSRYGTNGRTPLSTAARAWTALSWTMVLAGALAVASTARVFSGTVDEPAHLAGRNAVADHRRVLRTTSSIRRSARIAAALGPYLRGARRGQQRPSTTKAPGSSAVARTTSTRWRARATVSSSSLSLLALVVWFWARRCHRRGRRRRSLRCCSSPIPTFSLTPASRRRISRAPRRRRSRYSLAVWWVDVADAGSRAAFGAALALAVGSRLSALAFVGAPLGRVLTRCTQAVARRRWTIERVANRHE